MSGVCIETDIIPTKVALAERIIKGAMLSHSHAHELLTAVLHNALAKTDQWPQGNKWQRNAFPKEKKCRF